MTPPNLAVPTPRTTALSDKVQNQNWGFRDMQILAGDLERELILANQELEKSWIKNGDLREQMERQIDQLAQANEKLKVVTKALQRISEYDDEPIWEDDRDDAANHMLVIARDALTKITP